MGSSPSSRGGDSPQPWPRAELAHTNQADGGTTTELQACGIASLGSWASDMPGDRLDGQQAIGAGRCIRGLAWSEAIESSQAP